jgi:hypothetical protein
MANRRTEQPPVINAASSNALIAPLFIIALADVLKKNLQEVTGLFRANLGAKLREQLSSPMESL